MPTCLAFQRWSACVLPHSFEKPDQKWQNGSQWLAAPLGSLLRNGFAKPDSELLESYSWSNVYFFQWALKQGSSGPQQGKLTAPRVHSKKHRSCCRHCGICRLVNRPGYHRLLCKQDRVMCPRNSILQRGITRVKAWIQRKAAVATNVENACLD